MKALVTLSLMYSSVLARHLHQSSLSQLTEQVALDVEIDQLVDISALQSSVNQLVKSKEIIRAKKQTKKIAKQIKGLLEQIDSQKQQLAELKSQQAAQSKDSDTLKIIEDAPVVFGKGMTDPNEFDKAADDEEKPRDEIQGGEDDSEHKQIGEKTDLVDEHGIMKGDKVPDELQELTQKKSQSVVQKPQVAAQLTVHYSQLEQVQKQINLIAGMIPSIKDQRKRARVIRSIAPVLEDSLDQLLNGLRNGETMVSSPDATKMEASTTTSTKSSISQKGPKHAKVIEQQDGVDAQSELKNTVSNTWTSAANDLDRDDNRVSIKKQKRKVAESTDTDGIIRRKQKTTHERQRGDDIERTQHETHEEMDGRQRHATAVEAEDEQDNVQEVKERQRSRSNQFEAKKEFSVKSKLQEKKRLQARLEELNHELEMQQQTKTSVTVNSNVDEEQDAE